MRKVVAETLESIDGYGIVEAEAPTPGPGEVLVEVEAVGVGYADALVAWAAIRSGRRCPIRRAARLAERSRPWARG